MDKDKLTKKLIEVSKDKSKLESFIKELQNQHKKGDKKSLKYKPILAEKYQIAWKVKGADYYYCINGDTGSIILVRKDLINDDDKDIIINKLLEIKKDYWEVETFNGYLSAKNLPCKISEYTDIYLFASVAYWEILEKHNQELIDNFGKNYPNENIRLELHHINGDPNDNRLTNLIYLPKFIHAKVHVKSN